jgi:tetratricopeptide (TPR) repeat protein
LLLFPLAAFSQKDKVKVEPSDPVSKADDGYETQHHVYRNALRYNDLGTAAVALHQMLAIRPENSSLKDSLAYLYYGSGSFVQCILVGKDILESNPNNAPVLELVAISEQNLGAYKEALTDYEKLFLISKDPFHLYQVATLQYVLKRYLECKASLSQLILDEKITADMQIPITDPDRQTQEVSLKAAAYNMLGVVAMDLGEMEEAKWSFQEALKIAPDFVLAQGNLEKLNSETSD